jgi:AP-3 complex subunit delta-1
VLQLTSTKPYLRKKAVLMMYKVFLRFPEALRPAFPRLKEKLEDPDSGEFVAEFMVAETVQI